MSYSHKRGSYTGRKVKKQAVKRTATEEMERVIGGIDPVDLVNRS